VGLERIVVFAGIGIQIQKRNFLGQMTYSFIHESVIQSIILHEALSSSSCFYYVGIVLHDKEQTVVIFDSFRPRFEDLHQTFKGIRAVLYGER
jgi:phosphatidylinositol N-acetylglucosaminyltransferase subunit H